MVLPVAGILSYAGNSDGYIVAFTSRRLGLGSRAHLHSAGVFRFRPYIETNRKAGLAVCVIDASSYTCDVKLVFIPGHGKRASGRRYMAGAFADKCTLDSCQFCGFGRSNRRLHPAQAAEI